MTTPEIELIIANKLNYRRNIIIPNVSWGLNLHECDLLLLTRNGYLHEYELKISIADLRRDKKKAHHHYDNRIKKLWFCTPDLGENITDLIPNKAGHLMVTKDKKVVELKKPWANSSARQLTKQEKDQLMRLGVLRIWSMKERGMQ